MKPAIFLLSMLFSWFSFGQELPPINIFTTEDYSADNQNWMISQAPNKYIYVANNRGLLEFNGATWKTYSSPNNTIFRAVNVIGNRIYTGCYSEFGYWEKNEYGVLQYSSLISKLDKKVLDDEQIWNIIAYDDWVLFQSNSTIYFYNATSDNFKTVSSKKIIYKIFKVNDDIYYHVANEGVYKIEKGAPRLMISDAIVKTGRVINMFEHQNGLLLLTRNSGFYKFENEELNPWNIEADDFIKSKSMYSAIQLQDGSFVLGTISNGILHLSEAGSLNYQITQKIGLSNNTVLSLFEDDANNLWVGLDNGIDCVNIKSPIKTFFDYEGVLGTVYASQVFNGHLYIGTNQGLFFRKLEDPNSNFQFVEGTSGQVWDLFNYKDETLFCGHHLGTFVINENSATLIDKILGTWAFKIVPNKTNMLLKGNYDGLYILEKNDGQWQVKNKVEGFKNSSRYFEINDRNQVWISHEYKGVFKLKLNDSLTKVNSVALEKDAILSKNSSLVTYNGDILYATEKGIYKYDDVEQRFLRDSVLSTLIEEQFYTSGKLVTDKTGRLWAFSRNNISYVSTDNVTNQNKINHIPIRSHLRKGILGFENISLINEDDYVLGTSNGYITIDLSKIEDKTTYQVYLNAIYLKDFNDETRRYQISEAGTFDYKAGLILFKYSVPEYDKYTDVQYQYKLDGFTNKWSKWSNDSEATFENLSFGDYTFMVRAKIGNSLSKNTVSYSFTVNRPWYLSNVALILYTLVLILTGFIIHKMYNRYYSKMLKHKQLENEQTIMQIKNEKLNQEIESKNRELAISTMSIIKKNEVLNKIKKELNKSQKNSDTKSAIELIDTNLNNAKDWKFFKQAFNNADKDFLDKIKAAHPDLTPNDLRFCAYLRLNLSSKEIAPLLNISIKSVETKRYRLRKRLNLDHDDSLVNYILKF